MKKELGLLRESKVCSGEACISRDSLLSEKQNYQILSNSHAELEMQICHLSTNVDRQNNKMVQIVEDKKELEENLKDAHKRCFMYKTQLSKLEEELEMNKKSSSDVDVLRRDFEEAKINKSKIRMEMEFLLDERDTREVTLEEIYKQLTESRKELAALKLSDEELQVKNTLNVIQ